jgi:hypothetical protein
VAACFSIHKCPVFADMKTREKIDHLVVKYNTQRLILFLYPTSLIAYHVSRVVENSVICAEDSIIGIIIIIISITCDCFLLAANVIHLS